MFRMGMLGNLWEQIRGNVKWDAIKYGAALMTTALVFVWGYINELPGPILAASCVGLFGLVLVVVGLVRVTFSSQKNLVIHSAMYGLSPGSELDVLEQVRSIIERGERQIRVHPDTFGITDPYPGKTKRLLIMFSCGNIKRKTVTGADYGYINLPS
jgi:hypothetical protein